MILIAGVHPKIVQIDDKPVLCPVCGLAQAHYKRVDHYFNLFFIPILRVKKGDAFLMCERCERNIHEMGPEYDEWLEAQDQMCEKCGRALHPEFNYCPHCGVSQRRLK